MTHEASVLSDVRDMLPSFRDRAQQTEDARRVPDESVKALEEAGYFRLLQPARFGGFEADPLTLYTTVRLIASACGSTGWVASVLGVHPWHLGLFPLKAQEDVWGEDPTARLSSSYAPVGKATAVPGGVRLAGRWGFSSGCDHAAWVLLGGFVVNEDDTPADFRTFLVPSSDYTVVDVWDTVGLRGTGSNDIVVEDTFVPDHRMLSFADMATCVVPGQEANPSPLYKLPYGSVFTFGITTPIIGMATGAYEAHVDYQRDRVRTAAGGQKAKEDPHSQIRIARAAADIDAAWLSLERNITDMQRSAAQGQPISLNLRLRARRDQVLGTERAIAAVDLLFENSGGRALKSGTPLQRFWRDAHAGRVHAMNDVERVLTIVGAGEFGIEPGPGSIL